jgi:glycosyltransferase involved in cell wall biosynthesis
VRITLCTPVEEVIPAPAYGGIERIVHLLDRELARRGHQVTLLASGGSSSAGRLVALTAGPLGRHLDVETKERTAKLAAEALADIPADIVLNHWWRVLDHLPAGAPPVMTTVHYPLDADPYRAIFLARPQWRYVSISRSQQQAAPSLDFAANIYDGIDIGAMPFAEDAGTYLAFMGRFWPEKGADIAIRVALAAGVPLKIAAKSDHVHSDWFDREVAPLVRSGGVELVGELSAAEAGPFLAGALALLHPSRWSEPFGLAAVEAMACGTPVLALRRGAAPEIIRDGETGFVVDDEDELVHAVARIGGLSRAACRTHVESCFDYRIMVDGYEALAEAEAAA